MDTEVTIMSSVKKKVKRKEGINPIKNKKVLQIGLISMVVFVLVVVSMNLLSGTAKTLDLKIGQSKITQDQFLLTMNQEKNEVIHYFATNHKANIDNDFWEKDFNGEKPYQILMERTIDKLALNQAAYEFAQENEYVYKVDFDSFMNRLASENQSRTSAIDKGEIVYGLKAYTPELYQIYELDTFQKNYSAVSENEGMTIPDEVSQAFFENNKEVMFQKNDGLEFTYVQIYYAIMDISDDAVASLKQELIDVYQSMIKKGLSLKEVVADHPNLLDYYDYELIASSELSSKGKYMLDVLEKALTLDSGDVSGVSDENGSLLLIDMINHEYNEYLDFSEVKDNIVKQLREEAYEDIITKKASQIEINANEDKNTKFILSKLK